MQFYIDKATKDDAKEILELSKICGKETDFLSYGSDGLDFSLEQEEAYIEQVNQSLKDVFYVAKIHNEIVGMASYSTFSKERMSHRGEIGMCIRKSAWHQGIGRAFMEKLLYFARYQAHADIISLEVCSNNKRAITLYQNFGFVKIGTFEGFFKINGELIDFDMMQLKL